MTERRRTCGVGGAQYSILDYKLEARAALRRLCALPSRVGRGRSIYYTFRVGGAQVYETMRYESLARGDFVRVAF